MATQLMALERSGPPSQLDPNSFRGGEEPGAVRNVCNSVAVGMRRTCGRFGRLWQGFGGRWGNDHHSQPDAMGNHRTSLLDNGSFRTRSISSSSLATEDAAPAVPSSSSFSTFPRMPNDSFGEGQTVRRQGDDALEVRRPPLQPPSLIGAVLHVRVLSASNLKNLDSGRNTDTFVEVRVGGDMRRTSTVQGSLSPTWRESKQFKFRLEKEDTSVAFEAFGQSSTWKNAASLGSAKADITDFVPGKKLRARLPLKQVPGGGPGQGDIELEVCLLLAGQSLDFLQAFAEGESVQVWSNSQSKWFEDGLVEEVIFRSKVINGYKVAAGSVKVRFCDRKSVKYLNAQQARSILMKASCTHDWLDISSNEDVPDRAVRTGQDEDGGILYVARNKQGEPGKMTVMREPGPRTMNKIWCHQRDKVSSGDVLVLRPGCVAVWKEIKKGDTLPSSALHCKVQGEDSHDVYIARNKQGEAGKLTVGGEAGDSFSALPMVGLCCHSSGTAEEGEVLTIQEVSRELEIQLLRGEALGDPEHRLSDYSGALMGSSLLKPYVEAESDGFSWQSAFREAPSGNVEFRESIHVPLQADVVLDSLQLQIRAFDKRLRQKNDPLIGEGTLDVSSDMLGAGKQAECTVKLQRAGSDYGSLYLRVKEVHVTVPSKSRVPAGGPEAGGKAEPTEELIATEVRAETLPNKIGYCFQSGEATFRQTLALVAEALTAGPGGIIVVVLGSETQETPFEHLDEGLSTELSRSTVGNITDRPELFRVLLASSSTQTEGGRWDSRTLEEMSIRLGSSSSGGSSSALANSADLTGKPKGGVWILSARGTILATAARFVFESCCPYQLLPSGGHSLTLRHSEAMGIAYWMQSKRSAGAVFARWESGDVLSLLPLPPSDLGSGMPKPRDGRPAVFRSAAPFTRR